jgi:hypothetical protein
MTAAAARGSFTRLMARDGHEFDAWLTPASSTPRGAIIVLQEIFGVNSHIRAVAEGFAAEGYVVIAPALFDRVRRNVELDYSPPSVEQGRGYALQLTEQQILLDLGACINVVKRNGPVGVVGYCWGGSLAYLAACELVSATKRSLSEASGSSRMAATFLRWAGRSRKLTSARASRARSFRASGSTRSRSRPPNRSKVTWSRVSSRYSVASGPRGKG